MGQNLELELLPIGSVVIFLMVIFLWSIISFES